MWQFWVVMTVLFLAAIIFAAVSLSSWRVRESN